MSHAETPIVAEPVGTSPAAPQTSELIEGDSLVEEVSIDGMCGVY